LLQGNDAIDHFAELWAAIAKHYNNRDPEHLFFEILNEPEQTYTIRWQGIQSVIGRRVRAAAPGFTLILTGAHYSGLSDLMQLAPGSSATSICRNRFTTCSGWYFLPRPISSPCPVLSYSLEHFKPGTPQASSLCFQRIDPIFLLPDP
jgi:Cellulase (glycosyl hydrolase family 5)